MARGLERCHGGAPVHHPENLGLLCMGREDGPSGIRVLPSTSQRPRPILPRTWGEGPKMLLAKGHVASLLSNGEGKSKSLGLPCAPWAPQYLVTGTVTVSALVLQMGKLRAGGWTHPHPRLHKGVASPTGHHG